MHTTVLRTHRFLEISRETSNDHDHIVISFLGNKESDLFDVETCVDFLYGNKAFLKMQAVAEFEYGWPNWSYKLVLRAERFFKIIGHENYISVNLTT